MCTVSHHNFRLRSVKGSCVVVIAASAPAHSIELLATDGSPIVLEQASDYIPEALR
jgi:hypothetical protein